MADDSAPAQEVTAPSDDIHGIAKAAGVEMKKALEQNKEFAQEKSNLVWSYIKPYEGVLGPVMKHFEDQVFDRRHPEGGKLIWGKIFVTINDIIFDGSKHNNKPGDFWVLVLSIAEGDMIGQSLNLKTKLEIKKGGILLGYEITKV